MHAQTKAENTDSDSCSVSFLLMECIVPIEIAVRVAQFICKSLPTKKDLTWTIAMHLTLAKSIFFCLNVISYYCYTNSREPYYYSCIFHSGTSHGCQILFASSNNPLYCFSERSVSFIELQPQTLSLLTPGAGDSCSEWRMHTDVWSSYRCTCV